MNNIIRTPTDKAELDAQRDICSSGYSFQMTLDHIITACVFSILSSFCDGGDTDELEMFINEIEWDLPKVRFDFSVKPPPPPPPNVGATDEVVDDDFEGYEKMKTEIEKTYAV